MSFQPGANLYTQGFGSRPENVEVPHIDSRAPTVNDVLFPIGKRWVYLNNAEYVLVGLSTTLGLTTATWNLLGTDTGPLNTLTGNSGGAISPSAANINIVGSGVITVSGSGSTLTISETPGTGLVSTLTGDSGGAVGPTTGNINLKGTTNQITTTDTPGSSLITWSIPATFIAPGSIASTTTITAGSGLTVTTGGLTVTAGGESITGISTINTTGAAATTIGTGGTGTVSIGNATGNTSVTGTLTTSANLTVTAGGATITGTTGINTSGAAVTTIGTGGTGAVNIGNATGNTAVTGSLTASTSLTATLGNITATNGNVVLGTAGNKIVSTSVGTTTAAGANSFGSVALVGGTATVATTAVTANSLIFLTCQALGTVVIASGLCVSAKTASTSFVITASQATDTSTIAWFIVN